MSGMLRTRLFDLANYINEPDDVFAYPELLRDEDAGEPGAWNSAIEDLLACDSGRALPLRRFVDSLHETGLRIRIEPVQVNWVQCHG